MGFIVQQNIATLRRSKLSPEEIEELEKRERDVIKSFRI